MRRKVRRPAAAAAAAGSQQQIATASTTEAPSDPTPAGADSGRATATPPEADDGADGRTAGTDPRGLIEHDTNQPSALTTSVSHPSSPLGGRDGGSATPAGVAFLPVDGSAGVALTLPTAAEAAATAGGYAGTYAAMAVPMLVTVIRRGPTRADASDLAPWVGPVAVLDDDLSMTRGTLALTGSFAAQAATPTPEVADTEQKAPAAAAGAAPRGTLADQLEAEGDVSFDAGDVDAIQNAFQASGSAVFDDTSNRTTGAHAATERVQLAGHVVEGAELDPQRGVVGTVQTNAVSNRDRPPGAFAADGAGADDDTGEVADDAAERHVAAARMRAHGVDPTSSFRDMIAAREAQLQQRARSRSSTPRRGPSADTTTGDDVDASRQTRHRTPTRVSAALEAYADQASADSDPERQRAAAAAREAEYRRVRRAQHLFQSTYVFENLGEIPLPSEQRNKVPICKGTYEAQKVTVSVEWSDFLVIKGVNGLGKKTLLYVHPLIGNVHAHPLCTTTTADDEVAGDGKKPKSGQKPRLTFVLDRPPFQAPRDDSGRLTEAPQVRMSDDPPSAAFSMLLGSEWKAADVCDVLRRCVAESAARSTVYRVTM